MSLSISELSARYTVRRLTEADIPAILNVMEGNPLFYRYCGAGAAPSAALIRQDMTALPPGKTMPDKYYLGFFQGDRLAAVMDLIDGYPTPDIAFIGFFMTNSALQGQGEGTRIISELSAALHRSGFSAIQLGIDKGHPQSTHFWKKNGFAVLREIPQNGGIILLAQRPL